MSTVLLLGVRAMPTSAGCEKNGGGGGLGGKAAPKHCPDHGYPKDGLLWEQIAARQLLVGHPTDTYGGPRSPF